MIQIFHNPRCSKSRQGVAYLENLKVDFETITYLDNPITESELKEILQKLNVTAIQIVRKNEAIWKENFKGKELSEQEIIEAMVTNPKLIERPIIVNGNKAVIARPTEKIAEVL